MPSRTKSTVLSARRAQNSSCRKRTPTRTPSPTPTPTPTPPPKPRSHIVTGGEREAWGEVSPEELLMGFATSDSDAPPNYNHIILHPPPHHEVTNDTSSPIIYEVIIVSEELGIFIKLENDRLITSNPSKHSPIRSNSWILSIQGVDCSHLSVERLDRLLKATHRPLRIKLGWQQFKRDIKPGVPRPKEKVKVVKKRKLPTKPRSDGRDPWQPEEDAALLNGVKKYDLDFGRIKAEDNALPIPVLFRRTTRALGDHFRYVCPSRFKAMKASGHKVTFDIPITPINNTTPITPIVN